MFHIERREVWVMWSHTREVFDGVCVRMLLYDYIGTEVLTRIAVKY
jgi:hypothetical protein